MLLLIFLLLLAGDVISSAHKLQNMSVNPTSEKEKQKSEAKHLLMQKQRALAELFKHLATTGQLNESSSNILCKSKHALVF